MALVSKNFSDIVTFTRASSGTYFNSAGTLTTASNDVPRFDYNPSTLAAQGLLIEESRANLLTYSEQFDNAIWSKTNATVTANAANSPAGTVTADNLIADTTTSEHLTDESFSHTNGTAYTLSAFVKANGITDIGLRFTVAANWGGFSPQVRFDLTNGTTTVISGSPTSTISSVGNGWYRVSITSTAGATGSSGARLQLMNGTNNTFTGNGVSGVLVWGAQLEVGAFPTSYMPTTTAAVTRAADVASVNTLSPWYNAAAGTLYAEGSAVSNTTDSRFAVVDDGTNSNRYQIGIGASYQGNFAAVSGGAVSADLFSSALSAGSTVKLVAAYAVNDFALCANGGSVGTDTSGVLPVGVTTLRLGKYVGALGFLNGYLRRITYYPRRLSNTELQAITA